MQIRQFVVLVLGLALLLAAALPALASPSGAEEPTNVAAAGNSTAALNARALRLNATELAILRIKAQLATTTPEAGKGKNKRLLLNIAAWCLSKWTVWQGGCTYGNNCGGTCSTAVFGSGLKLFGLLSPWQKKTVDDLDDMCYQRDVCRFKQQQQSPSSGVCSDVMGCQTEITTCDKPLYDKCQNIIVACPWWTLCYWARRTAAAVAIKQAMAARLLWAGVNVQV